MLVTLVNWFSLEKPGDRHLALVQGTPPEDQFTVDAKMIRYPIRLGYMRVDSQHGKRSRTVFEVREKFAGYTHLQCEALTRRLHQIRVHLRYAGLSAVGDLAYGGRPLLLYGQYAVQQVGCPAQRIEISTARLHLTSVKLHFQDM